MEDFFLSLLNGFLSGVGKFLVNNAGTIFIAFFLICIATLIIKWWRE